MTNHPASAAQSASRVLVWLFVFSSVAGCGSEPTATTDDSRHSASGKTVQSLGEVTDLLSIVDTERDAVAGTWRLESGRLVSPPVQAARLQIPFELPDEYTLRMMLQRTYGNDSFNVGLPLGVDRHVLCVIDGYNGRSSGLSLVDGKTADANSTTQQGVMLLSGRVHQLEFRVKKDAIDVVCDGKPFIHWSGDCASLSLETSFWGGAGPRHLLVGCWNSCFEISKLEVVPGSSVPAVDTTMDRSKSSEATQNALQLPAGWIWHGGDGFRAAFPGQPQITETESGQQMLTATPQGAFLLNVIHFELIDSPVQLLFDLQKDFTGSDKLISSAEDITPGTQAGRRFVIHDADGDAQIVRLLAVGNRVLQATVITPIDREESDETQCFLDSLAILQR